MVVGVDGQALPKRHARPAGPSLEPTIGPFIDRPIRLNGEVIALASAWWVARRWARPLHAVQEATERIARGEFDVRLQGWQDGEGRSDEVGDLVRNVNRMAEGLQQLAGARRRWLAEISHELRTPLTVMRGVS
jgi:signal transduction histidine kinase